MATSRITNKAFMIDTLGLGNPNTVAVFVVKGARKTAVIDCGYASSYENVLKGLGELGIVASSVDYLVPTHVHLDHAGAAGHLIGHMPRATVIAHERAVPHLVDPTKLIESATSVFGERLIRTYGHPLPIGQEKISAVGEESHIDLGGGTSLTTLHSPGHAPHQISVLFEEEHLLFSADAVGIVFPTLGAMIPTTPPPSLDPVKLAASVELLRHTDPKMLLVPHFGVREDVGAVLDRTKEATDRWIKDVTKFNDAHMTPEEMVSQLTGEITEETGIAVRDIPEYATVSIRTSVLGILFYLKRMSAQASQPRTP